MSRNIFCLLLLLTVFACQAQSNTAQGPPLKKLRFDDVREVLIVGTYHFDQESNKEELDTPNQMLLERLMADLEAFKATKVFVEKDPKHDSVYKERYQQYLASDGYIKDKRNELYQLGCRMAKRLGHGSIYLFDNKPPFIGSLENFSFETFGKFKDTEDETFNKKHYEQINRVYQYNDSVKNSSNIYDHIKYLNSKADQEYNIQRMHAIEIRSGIDDTWFGADWLGRWYQRNIRMMMHVMQQSEPSDRIIIFVGSNHKWVLEQLMNNTPEFKIVDTMLYLEGGPNLKR